MLLAHQNEDEVVDGIMNSPEYMARDVSNAVFASDLYVRIFGRLPDPGVATWQQALDAGVSRAVVVDAFLHSQESAALAVDSFYAAYFHRPGDANGRAGWINALTSGSLTFSQVALGFLISPENQMQAANAVP